MADRQIGTIKWFDTKKGYGFIRGEESDENIFVHYGEIRGDGFRTLIEGQTVEYSVNEGDKGLAAQDVSVRD